MTTRADADATGGSADVQAPARASRPNVEDVPSASVSGARPARDSAEDGAVFTLDVDGHVVTWNDDSAQMTGFSCDDVIGKHVSCLYCAADVAAGKPQADVESALETGRHTEQGWRVRNDGGAFWATSVLRPLRTGAAVVGFVVVMRDCEPTSEARDRRRTDEGFRLLVDSVEEYAIYRLDVGGRVLTWNRGARRLMGYDADAIVGQHFSAFYPPERVASGQPEVALAAATATGHFKEEGWRLRHGGSPFWANVVITALRDTEGELIGFAKVTRDMSDRRDAEQKVAEAYRAEAAALHTADLAKDQFLSRVSHELRTPLNAILGFGQLLQLEGPAPEQVESIDEIMNAGRHLLALIDDVLDITQVAGDLELALEQIDIAAAVDDVVQLLTPFAAARGILVTAPSPRHDGVDVLADRRRLRQVLVNLLFNAIKYNDEGGTVRITFETRPMGQVVLSITDSGPGIDEDKLTLIFAPFERLDAARSNIEGTGLGLALARRLVEAMGGVIGVESTRDEGSTFWVELPSVTTPSS